jgi:hypothetical protein
MISMEQATYAENFREVALGLGLNLPLRLPLRRLLYAARQAALDQNHAQAGLLVGQVLAALPKSCREERERLAETVKGLDEVSTRERQENEINLACKTPIGR